MFDLPRSCHRQLIAMLLAGWMVLLTPPMRGGETNSPPLRADSRIDGAGLAEDIDILEHAYKDLHPGLYRYNKPWEIDLRFDQLREQLRAGASLSDAFIAFTEFGASIRCGHTYANFYNQPKAVVHALLEGTNRVPFHFRWLGNRMFVSKNFSGDERLARGAEIVAINGVRVQEILERLMKLARADGSNDAKRRALLEVKGADRYEPFDIYYALCFQPSSEFQFSVIPAGKRTAEAVAVRALSYTERLAERETSGSAVKKDGAEWTLTQLTPNTSLLRMPSWALYNTKWDWKTFLNGVFTNLSSRPKSSLIIDVRDNEGGLTEIGFVIASHLIRNDLAAVDTHRFVRARSVPRDLVPHLDTWDWSFLDWGTNALDPSYHPLFDTVYYRMTKFDDGAASDLIVPQQPFFPGKLVVLMNSENSSATFQFEQIIQQNKLGTLIGQPSGGNRRGINGGAFFFLQLPNSKIEMDLPLVATIPSQPQPDAGLVPDKLVELTPSGLASGRDEVLEAALKFLREKVPSSQ